MQIGEKDIKRFSVIVIGIVLAFLTFILVKPVIASIVAGLILAYIFSPIYDRVYKKTKRPNLSAVIVSLLTLLIIVLPFYFLIPLMIEQSFQVFTSLQEIDYHALTNFIFSGSSEAFAAQMATTASSFVSKIASGVLSYLVDFLLDFPNLLMRLVIVGFVFFFTLRDKEELKKFVGSISPFGESKKKMLIKQFKDLTDSILFGQVVVGIIQGLIAGFGFFIFGISNPLVLMILAILMGIIPVVGPVLLWVPLSIFFFISGDFVTGTLFVLYNAILVSGFDNILRAYIVSRKTDMSQVILLVGMLGGLLVFGVMGIIVGPLILAYFLGFIKAYRDKEFSDLFSGR